jgi:AraC-like DNA-binding protein
MNPAPGSPVGRALWFIESHFGREVTLDQISEVACVSRYHMSRMFAMSMGIPVMRYLRARRLSEAARALVNDESFATPQRRVLHPASSLGLPPRSLRKWGCSAVQTPVA